MWAHMQVFPALYEVCGTPIWEGDRRGRELAGSAADMLDTKDSVFIDCYMYAGVL